MKLIAFDLDGTLLSTEKTLSPENLAALRRAAEAGIELVPATGRFYGAIPDCVRSLPYFRYFITVNGAQIYDRRTGEALLRAEIPRQRAAEVMACLDPLPVLYDCYIENWGWMTRAHYERAAEFAPTRFVLEAIRKLRTPVPELKSFLAEPGSDVQKISVFFRDMGLRAETMAELSRRFPDLAVTSSIPGNAELNSLEARKGVALTRLAERLGIAPEQTMAFGDDLNDVSMLQAAGIGVAMGNAGPEVKAAADCITASCDESGFAGALETLIFAEKQEG